ncbi:MAG: TM1812 family CRISPR-associated protein [Thermofilaceae archaeon]
MSGGVLIVSTWGDPSRWAGVRYRFRELAGRARSALPLILYGAGRGARALILVPDTLYASPGLRAGSLPGTWGELEREVRCWVEKVYGEFVDAFEVEEESLDEGVRGWLKGSVEVLVCPGFGRFRLKDRWLVFRGSLQLYKSVVLLHVLKKVLDAGGVDEVWLDLTHGVNYMPSTALVAVLAALRVLRFKLKDLRLRILNSDPFPGPEGGLVELAVHEMVLDPGFYQFPNPEAGRGRKLLHDVLDLLQQPQTLLSVDFRGVAGGLRELGERLSGAREVFESLWYAASFGFPLVALDYAPRLLGRAQLPRLREVVDELIGAVAEALRGARLAEEGGEVTVDTACLISEGRWRTLEVLLEAYSAAEALLEAVERYRPVEVGGRRGYRLSDLWSFAEQHLKPTAPHVEYLLSNEENNLLKCLLAAEACGKLERWCSFRELEREARERERELRERWEELLEDREFRRAARERVILRYRDGYQPSYRDRVFITHSGLPYDGVEVYCSRGQPRPDRGFEATGFAHPP